jgi:hypothetical protein
LEFEGIELQCVEVPQFLITHVIDGAFAEVHLLVCGIVSVFEKGFRDCPVFGPNEGFNLSVSLSFFAEFLCEFKCVAIFRFLEDVCFEVQISQVWKFLGNQEGGVVRLVFVACKGNTSRL